ncbi:MAG TPA: hypothetical protein VJH65_01365 [Candidatus Nanoarchaeia archaeon]|nr:hypothetical protein [Candidatus Nanoarchaeia archaeon]
MKRGLYLSLILFLISILILPAISSVQIDIKSNYSQGETLIAKVSGNFIENIKEENVIFYRKHVKIPMIFNLEKINDEFYIYAQLYGREPENYSISIEGVKYMKGPEISEEQVKKNFTITQETAPFTIKPGVIQTQSNYSITLQNIRDYSIIVYVNKKEVSAFQEEAGSLLESIFGGGNANETSIKTEYEKSIELKSGEIKSVDFMLNPTAQAQWTSVSLTAESLTYEIPVYLLASEITQLPQEQPSDNISVIGNETELPEEKNKTAVENLTKDELKFKTCIELGGKICLNNTECSGEEKYAKDSLCCFGECREKQKSNTKKIIGWTLFIIAIVLVAWFFLRYKQIKKPKINLLEAAYPKRR